MVQGEASSTLLEVLYSLISLGVISPRRNPPKKGRR
jgi:hypothetical protein